jgi:guanylate kinase
MTREEFYKAVQVPTNVPACYILVASHSLNTFTSILPRSPVPSAARCQGRLHEMKRKRQEQEGYSREVANDYLEELSRRKRAEEAAQAQ